MTYEEKLDLIINEIVEARKRTRAGQPTKIFVDKRSEILRYIIPQEIYDILLKLQDDEKIIKVQSFPSDLDERFVADLNPNKDHFAIEILSSFDNWYESYLLAQKSRLTNIDFINLLKIYDIVLDIEQQLQIDGSSTIHIPSLPQLVRFQLLFPIDSIGNRQNYQGYRWEGVKFLFQRSIVVEHKYVEDYLGYGSIKLTVDVPKFNSFLKEIVEEYKKRNGSTKPTDKQQTTTTKTKISKAIWPKDFRWEGKFFVFGKYGKISFTSNDRKHILKTLTDKQGGWATIAELKGDKDASYVRSTIKHIEDRLSEEARKHITLVSTQEDDFGDKPSMGAYRIRVSPKA